MATSFFEKLTGASNEEEIEIAGETKKPAKKKKKPAQDQSAGGRKIIKEESLDMPKTKKKQPPKKIEPKEMEEKPSTVEPLEEKDKDWLEEAEGEEGQLTIDVYQTTSDIVIKSTIAGVNPEEVDISITNDMVTIKGRRTKDEKIETENYYYQELYWGAFSRSVILPIEVDADKAKASIKNGILTIKLPKSEKVKTKKIRVRTVE